jgi:hypothetical protein
MEDWVEQYAPKFHELLQAHNAGQHQVLPNGYCRECSRQIRALTNKIIEERRGAAKWRDPIDIGIAEKLRMLRLRDGRRTN